jgi:flagellar basal body rod protein FlgF
MKETVKGLIKEFKKDLKEIEKETAKIVNKIYKIQKKDTNSIKIDNLNIEKAELEAEYVHISQQLQLLLANQDIFEMFE